uniref:Uncharacterized protein n=1 Tax=Nothoprocta perdicaria TaxID=30464 RepID=A0A8C6ZI32_NOTPE
MDPAEAVLQEKALKFMVRGRGGGFQTRPFSIVLSLQCSMPRSLWLGCSSLADSMPSLRCLYNPGTGALPAFQIQGFLHHETTLCQVGFVQGLWMTGGSSKIQLLSCGQRARRVLAKQLET